MTEPVTRGRILAVLNDDTMWTVNERGGNMLRDYDVAKTLFAMFTDALETARPAAATGEHAIERAVEVVWECGPWTDQESLRIVRALADAGLLAPAPLREEEAVVVKGGAAQFDSIAAARAHAERHGLLQKRWATDWVPADDVNRSEGDGRAVTHG